MSGHHLSLSIHLVWSTARREPIIAECWRGRLYGFLGGILERKSGRLLRAGGTADHIHLLVSLPSTVTLAEVVGALKANSSRWIHETFPESKDFAWQKGYGAFAVSKSLEPVVIRYIENQQTHHQKRNFQDEFHQLLKLHEISFNEMYLWD